MREAESLSVFHEKKVKIPKGIYDPLTDIRVWFNPVAAYSRISWIFRDVRACCRIHTFPLKITSLHCAPSSS